MTYQRRAMRFIRVKLVEGFSIEDLIEGMADLVERRTDNPCDLEYVRVQGRTLSSYNLGVVGFKETDIHALRNKQDNGFIVLGVKAYLPYMRRIILSVSKMFLAGVVDYFRWSDCIRATKAGALEITESVDWLRPFSTFVLLFGTSPYYPSDLHRVFNGTRLGSLDKFMKDNNLRIDASVVHTSQSKLAVSEVMTRKRRGREKETRSYHINLMHVKHKEPAVLAYYTDTSFFDKFRVVLDLDKMEVTLEEYRPSDFAVFEIVSKSDVTDLRSVLCMLMSWVFTLEGVDALYIPNRRSTVLLRKTIFA